MARTKEEQRIYDRNKNLMYERDDWKCRNCNRRNGLHPHHVIYQGQQGSDDLNNLLTLCAWCHRAVHDGLLRVDIIEQTKNDIVVTFWRQRGWKP